MPSRARVTACGAGGFVDGHPVKSLLASGVKVVRAFDIKPLRDWYQVSRGVESLSLDLKDKDAPRGVNGRNSDNTKIID